mmetsp:Transcript_52052/g.97652  ORF Transcript_52052/g.97652 Transcript_52052/m.97652 type:complete len:279 (+) Transcript_52052:105-941(+)
MMQNFQLRQQQVPYTGEQGRSQVDVKFPRQEASSYDQRFMMFSLGSPEAQQMQASPQWMCAEQMAIELQHKEVGSAAWAQAVKCAILTLVSESTTGSGGSDNMDARTSEDSSCELDSPHAQDLEVQHQRDLHQPGALRSTSAPTSGLFKDSVPVRHTFVHFDFKADDHTLRRSNSAPEIMCTSIFQRKRNPEMEALHIKGDCRPCAYFFHKADGCRWGTECTFCHLCPPEAVKAKRKEKMKAMKRELFEQAQLSKQFQPSVYWRHRKYAAKQGRSKAD